MTPKYLYVARAIRVITERLTADFRRAGPVGRFTRTTVGVIAYGPGQRTARDRFNDNFPAQFHHAGRIHVRPRTSTPVVRPSLVPVSPYHVLYITVALTHRLRSQPPSTPQSPCGLVNASPFCPGRPSKSLRREPRMDGGGAKEITSNHPDPSAYTRARMFYIFYIFYNRQIYSECSTSPGFLAKFVIFVKSLRNRR